MKTYWDYSETERTELTSEQVTALLKYEQMEAGIIVPPHPGEEPDDTPADVTRVTIYGVKVNSYHGPDLWFENPEDAQKVAELKPFRVDYDYQIGEKYSYIAPREEISVVTKEVAKSADLDGMRQELQRVKKALTEYKSDLAKHNEAAQKASDASQSVWDDWYEQLQVKAEAERIVATFDRYVEDCDGSEKVACRFLRKAYDDELIEKSFDRLGKACPFPLAEAEGVPS